MLYCITPADKTPAGHRKERQMRAAVYQGKERFEIREWPTPVCGDDEVLVRVNYCAICGTDVRIYFHGHAKVKPPAIIGHEITGTVAEVGRNVSLPGISVGDPVTTVTSTGCGTCRMCRQGYYNLCPDTRAIGYYFPGGFAEYLVIPAVAVRQNALIKLPDGMPLLDGTLIEPLSCAINGQQYLRIGPGDTVVIFGGGPIGLMHARLAQARGAERVVVVDPAFERLQRFGRQFEGLLLMDPAAVDVKEEVRKMTGGFGADVVITACPVKQAQIDGLQMLGSRGRISFFGGLPKDDSVVPLDTNLIHYKELGVFGAFASNRRDFEEAARLLASGSIEADRFISRVVPLDRIAEGIDLVRRGEVLKCVVEVARPET